MGCDIGRLQRTRGSEASLYYVLMSRRCIKFTYGIGVKTWEWGRTGVWGEFVSCSAATASECTKAGFDGDDEGACVDCTHGLCLLVWLDGRVWGVACTLCLLAS